jgi:hypothetical protein
MDDEQHTRASAAVGIPSLHQARYLYGRAAKSMAYWRAWDAYNAFLRSAIRNPEVLPTLNVDPVGALTSPLTSAELLAVSRAATVAKLGLQEAPSRAPTQPRPRRTPSTAAAAVAAAGTAPTEVSSTPTGVSSAPTGVSSTPTGVSSAPTEVSSTPTGVSSAPTEVSSTPTGATGRLTRLVIGFVSSYFRDHNLLRLTRSLFQRYDRSRLRVVLFAESDDDGSAILNETRRAVDSFTRIRSLPTSAAIEAMAREGLHLAINLNGHHWNAASETVMASDCL